jgi:hypothetical protein
MIKITKGSSNNKGTYCRISFTKESWDKLNNPDRLIVKVDQNSNITLCKPSIDTYSRSTKVTGNSNYGELSIANPLKELINEGIYELNVIDEDNFELIKN